jgi:thiol:disulfide interchange protein
MMTYKKINRSTLFVLLGVIGLSIAFAACSNKFKPQLNSAEGVNFKVTTLARAQELSKAQNKPLFVFAHASWCPTCKKMEQEVLVKKELGETYNAQLINVAIDVDSPEGKKLNEQYPIRATPTLFFFNPDGTLTKKLEGFTTDEELLGEAKELKK